jgi:hypothetical protein
LNDNVDILDNIDPDSNFFNSNHRDPTSCQYFQIDALNKKLNNLSNLKSFSILNLNIRSLKKNHKQLNQLTTLINHSFSIIAHTETGIKPHKTNLFLLDGYQHVFLIGPEKIGGGISLFINNDLDYKLRPDLSSIDQTAEILWIEIDKKKWN